MSMIKWWSKKDAREERSKEVHEERPEIASCMVWDGPDWLIGAGLVGLGVSVVGVMYYEWVGSRL